MARTQRATGGRRSTRIAWALAGLLAACGGATVSGTHGAGSDGGGSGGLAASGGAGATPGAGGSDAGAGASGTGGVAGSGGAAGDATAGDAAAGAGEKDAGCPAGYADCNGDPSDGCEAQLATDLDNCGACGNVCATTVAGCASCVNGVCALPGCTPPFADCDCIASNGCETNTNTDVNNCGLCGSACPAEPHSSPLCSAGACQLQCDPGWADCDGLYSTGCETDLSSDANNCGGCGVTCSTLNGSGSCIGGSCFCGCTPGYANCNGTCADGCETNVSNDVNNCGGCGIVCGTQHALAQCIAGACQPKCDPGWGDCDGNPTNGCETNLAADVNNCGGCGQACGSGGGCAICVGGVCGVCACTPPYADCDGDPSTPCETNLDTDPANCGACGHACATGQSCVSGSCQ